MEDRRQEDGAGEERQESEEESIEESSSSAYQEVAVGQRVTGFLLPPVEALVIARKIKEDTSVEVTILIAPFRKKGQWVKAAVCIRHAQKFQKKPLENYKFRLPWFDKLAREAIRNRGDPDWIRVTLEDINSMPHQESKEPGRSTRGKEEERICNKLRRDSSADSVGSGEGGKKTPVIKIPKRKPASKPVTRTWSLESKDSEGEDAPRIDKKKGKKASRSIWGHSAKEKRAARRACRSSSSDSHGSSDSGDSFGANEVGFSDKEESGIIYCPFSSRDVRRYIDVRATIKGKITERKFVRQTLQNLYTHYTNLQAFVDYIRAKSNNSSDKPFPSELIWLEHHAVYIDTLLFGSLKGMWSLWNEPVVDVLVLAFLELVVRCTPRRQYPDKLEERVRRWMKKNQIGISSAYGAVPSYLQNAKLSERGVVMQASQNAQYVRPRGMYGGNSDFRGNLRGRGHMASGYKRGGHKTEKQEGAHE